MRSWKIVSLLTLSSMALFLSGQCFITLRNAGFSLYDIIVFPPYLLGIILLLCASFAAVVEGVALKKIVSICIVLLGLLTLHSLARGRYNSSLMVREAFFSPYGIGAWLSFLFALPASRIKFWSFFRRSLILLYLAVLILEIPAILLLLDGNKGLFRINFSSSVSLFLLCWGLLSSDRSLTILGLLGLPLFELHSFIHDQRETFLMPIEFLLLLFPVYITRKDLGIKRGVPFIKTFTLLLCIYVLFVFVLLGYIVMPRYYRAIVRESHLTKDTRSTIVKDFFDSEMRYPKYYLFGKGVTGSYTSTRPSNRLGERWRAADIEIGYLQTVLNVGLVYVILILLVGIIPSVKAMVRGPNSLIVASGMWVFIRLLNMLIAARPAADLGWFLFWVSIGVINSRELWRYNDSDLEKMRVR